MPAQKNKYIESTYERLEYEAREKAILDHNQMMLEAEERGREQGEDRINKLNTFLIHENRYEDLERSTRDKEYQRQLMDQYGI